MMGPTFDQIVPVYDSDFNSYLPSISVYYRMAPLYCALSTPVEKHVYIQMLHTVSLAVRLMRSSVHVVLNRMQSTLKYMQPFKL